MTEETQYDVFLSHNSVDKPAVEAIARRLREEARLEPFLDKWHLVPGEPWQEALEEALKQSKTIAVFVGTSGVSPWHNEEMRAGLDQAVRSHDDMRIIPILLPGADPETLPPFLTRRTYVDFRVGLDDSDAFARLVAGILGQPPKGIGTFTLPDEPAPYPGLRPFTTRQEAFFFGRTKECDDLLERVEKSPFVAVVGASGSGKSSLVMAGVLPRLDQGWRSLTLMPGARPLRALADQLATLAPEKGRLQLADDLEARLIGRADGLSTAASTLLAGRKDTSVLLIVVDQFEELFTQVVGTPEAVHLQRSQFIANLVEATRTSEGRVRVVLALRADFVQPCLEFPDLRALLESNQLLLGPMHKDALREAIVKPAQAVGAMFEKGLVGRLMEDMHHQAGALPLMQFALAQLWQRRHGVWLTHAAYEAIGGISGAINRRADAVYRRLNEKQQHLARNLFVRMVALGEHTIDTRRRVQREELKLVGVAADDVEEILNILSCGNVRLVTMDADTIELAHEALIEQWARLQRWLQQDRATLHTQRELTRATQEWERHGRDASYLYRGSRLAKVEQWPKVRQTDLSTVEHDFIAASITAQQAERAAHRRQRALRVTVVGLSVLIGIALITLLWMSFTGTGLFESTGHWENLGHLEVWGRTIAVDPTDPSTLYVGTNEGEVLRSHDGGQTWTPILVTSTPILNLTFSPLRTLYAGTEKGTLFRSDDGGNNWVELGVVLDAAKVDRLAVDHQAPETVYVCDSIHPYIYRSTNGGTDWFTITVASNGSPISALATASAGEVASVVYASSESGYIWHSVDQGASWQSSFQTSPLPYIIYMAVNPDNANVLYALTFDGLYRVQADTMHSQVQLLTEGLSGVSVTADPRSPGTVFVSTFDGNIYMVQDHGDSPRDQQIASEKDFLHSDFAEGVVASDRSPYYLYVATQKGVFGWKPSYQMKTWFD